MVLVLQPSGENLKLLNPRKKKLEEGKKVKEKKLVVVTKRLIDKKVVILSGYPKRFPS